MKKIIGLAAALLSVSIAPVWAQDADEIIVTGSRYSAYEELTAPHIFEKRRADFVIVELEVRSDTRDYSTRRNEIRDALRALEGRARQGSTTLVLTDEENGLVRPFSLASAEEIIRGDNRPDSSVITIRLRTPVGADDTLEAINERLERFVSGATKPGRVEMEMGDGELTLVDPEQYREGLVRAIAADGQAAAAAFGAGYGVVVTGLDRRVAWQRTGDLELTLFINYAMSIGPQR